MAECPFCGAAVQNDLVMYGGPCPKCFAEIPGEEAPTDPGAEARAVQERRDRRGATIKAFVGLAAMAAVVTCTGIAALTVVLWPEPEVAVLDFDSMEYGYPEIELVGKEIEDEVADAAVVKVPMPKAPKNPKSPNVDGYVPAPGVPGGDDAATAREGLGTDGVAQVEDGGPRGTRPGTDGPAEGPGGIDGLQGSSKPKSVGFDDVGGVDIGRRSEVLTDPDQIRLMIGKLMQMNMKTLNYCYERQLKSNPDLGGRWMIKYTVTKEGRAIEASATGRDRSNAELEECLAKNIQDKWKFDRIIRDQPVQKTLTFRPG